MTQRRYLRHTFSTKIILRPSKAILDDYFREDTKNYAFSYDALDTFEISAMFTLLETLKPKSIFRLPVVNYPEHIYMPDFLFDNIPIEIKTPQSKRGLEGRIRASKEQLKRGGILALNLDNYRESLVNIGKTIDHYLKLHEIRACLALLNNHLIHSFPTKKWLPVTYAGGDRH